MIIYAEDGRFEIEPETTLKKFLLDNEFEDGLYTINGEAKPLNTILGNYNVIEESPLGTMFDSDETSPEQPLPSVVEVELSDFTGFFGRIWVADNLAAVRERYNQQVKITVIRNGEKLISANDLRSEDKLFVAPGGGMKGASK